MSSTEPSTVRAALGWLSHPGTLVALAVLIINDQVLKRSVPGLLTGKLSDVAGLVLAPALLMVLISPLALPVRRDRLALGAVLVTGLGFAGAKATAAGAGIASAAWTVVAGPSLVRQDLTDLLALPALGLAWWTWRHRPAERLRLALAVVPIAVLATTATSQAEEPGDATKVGVWNGRVVVTIGGDYADEITTPDGAGSWRALTSAELFGYKGGTNSPPPAQVKDCEPDRSEHCYQVVPGHLAVQESQDGGRTWTRVWAATADEESRLRKETDGLAFSAGLAVVNQGGGHIVVVANRRAGITVRDTTGTWRQLAVPKIEDYPSETPSGTVLEPIQASP